MVLSTKDVLHLALFFLVVLNHLTKRERGQVNNKAIRTERVVPGHGIATPYPGSAVSEVANLIKLCANY